MYGFLKHTHLTLVLIAVILFIVQFYWLKSGHKNAQKAVFQKVLSHVHITIILLGIALMWFLQITPFEQQNFWLLEKIIAFGAYIAMVKTALNENKATTIQVISFLGAFGWLAYIAQLAFSKQAILLVG